MRKKIAWNKDVPRTEKEKNNIRQASLGKHYSPTTEFKNSGEKEKCMKRKKKTEKQLLEIHLDRIFKDCLLIIADYRCEFSGLKNNLQVSHYISRENKHLRWVFDNCIIANAGIHKWTLENHKNTIYRTFMIDHIGLNKVEGFELKSRVRTKPLYLSDLKVIKQDLLIKLYNLKKGRKL